MMVINTMMMNTNNKIKWAIILQLILLFDKPDKKISILMECMSDSSITASTLA